MVRVRVGLIMVMRVLTKTEVHLMCVHVNSANAEGAEQDRNSKIMFQINETSGQLCSGSFFICSYFNLLF